MRCTPWLERHLRAAAPEMEFGASRADTCGHVGGTAVLDLDATMGERAPDDIVFWGAGLTTPLSKTAILKRCKSALGKIGISEQQRAARVSVFHSRRHGLNTLLRGKVADEQLRRITGHKTLVLTDSYDHVDTEHLVDVLVAQGELFDLSHEEGESGHGRTR